MQTKLIDQLMSQSGKPAVSIVCPTHGTIPDNRQDSIRLRGLIGDASEQLSARFPEATAQALRNRLYELEKSIDYQHTRKGVGLFVTEESATLVHFPVEVKERISVREEFSSLPLIAALNRSTRYRVLVLSESRRGSLRGSGII